MKTSGARGSTAKTTSLREIAVGVAKKYGIRPEDLVTAQLPRNGGGLVTDFGKISKRQKKAWSETVWRNAAISREAAELVRFFGRISNRSARASIMHLAKAMAENDEALASITAALTAADGEKNAP